MKRLAHRRNRTAETVRTPDPVEQSKRPWWHVSRGDSAEVAGAVCAIVWGAIVWGAAGAFAVAAICLIAYGFVEDAT